MKKRILFSVVFAIISVAVFAQVQDSTVNNVLTGFGISPMLAKVIVGVLVFILGHWGIPNKWVSPLKWVEKIAYALYVVTAWINDRSDKTNKKERATFQPRKFGDWSK